MITIPATEFSKNFGYYRELAQREPIAITAHEGVAGYYVSNGEYEEYIRMKRFLPKAYAVEELSEKVIQEIAAAKMDLRHEPLNRLMDDGQ